LCTLGREPEAVARKRIHSCVRYLIIMQWVITIAYHNVNFLLYSRCRFAEKAVFGHYFFYFTMTLSRPSRARGLKRFEGMLRITDADAFRATLVRGIGAANTGWYFVTICLHDIRCMLAGIDGGNLRLTPMGETADRCRREIPAHFPHTQLDEYGIMPDHVHGIIRIMNVDRIDRRNRRHVCRDVQLNVPGACAI